MSHFAVLVILPHEPTDDKIAAALQPFHEYECTGIDDQYVTDVDVTEEVEAGWIKPAKMVRLANGTAVSRWSDTLYTGPAEAGSLSSGKTFVLPEGATEFEVPLSESGEYASIDDYAEAYGGWTRHADGRFYKHTNPNAHWDWYQLGGRYSGKLRTLTGRGVKGQPGLAESQTDANGVDIARRSDLDFDTMKLARIGQRAQWLDKIRDESGLGTDDLDRALRLQPQVTETWQNLPDPKPRGAEYSNWIENSFGDDGKRLATANRASWDLPELGKHTTGRDWANDAPAFTCWAVVKEGQWTEKGSMGWWGISTGDIPQEEWEAKVSEFVENLPGDHWLAVVDCHI